MNAIECWRIAAEALCDMIETENAAMAARAPAAMLGPIVAEKARLTDLFVEARQAVLAQTPMPLATLGESDRAALADLAARLDKAALQCRDAVARRLAVTKAMLDDAADGLIPGPSALGGYGADGGSAPVRTASLTLDSRV